MPELPPTKLQTIADPRGSLTVAETGGQLPFVVERIFIVHGVPAGTVRGEHAHRRCQQYLIATAGVIEVTLDDGRSRREVRLSGVSEGLHIPAGVWGRQRYVTDDAVLLVLTSERYDPADYITDYGAFVAFAKGEA